MTQTINSLPIGQQIRYWRKERGLTMQQLADKTGLSGKQAVYQYENSLRIPSPEIIQKIAKALHCRYNEFFSEEV